MAMSFEQFLALIRNGSVAPELAAVHGFLTAVALHPGDMEQLPWLHVLCGSEPTQEISERADQAIAEIRAALQAGNFSPLIAAEADCLRWCAGFVRAVAVDDRAWREFSDAFPEAGKPLLYINLVANPELYADLDISTQPHQEFVREGAPLLGATVRKMAAYLLADADARATLDEADLLETWCEGELRAMSDDELMADLIEHEDRVPRILIDECIRRGDAFVTRLRAHLADDHLWSESCSSGEWWAVLHAAFILGAIPGREAADTLLLVFGKMHSHPDDHVWDWLNNHWPILFQNKREHVAAGLEAVVCDRDSDAAMRYEAWAALLEAGQANGPMAFEAVLDRLAQVAADAREDDFMVSLVGFLLLDFPRERHRALLENLAREFERTQTWGRPFGLRDVERAFARGDDPPPWERHRDYLSFYNPAEIRRRQQRWREEDERSTRRAAMNETRDWEPVEEPYIRLAPKIGRNDPCPCGSGKKYKKCCLGAE